MNPPKPGRDDAQPDANGGATRWKGLDLSPFQVRSVEAIRAGRSVLVSAPTGAGKTLVAEYAIADAVRRGKRAIYTSPIKALSNQKYRDFRDDPDIDVGLLTGDVTIHPHARVLIMTTEILRNAIFENPELLADVEFVIFDEVHYMDDRERGTVWEESLIFLPKAIRLICLSATISNIDQIGAWLTEIREHEIEIVRSSRRPVPLSHWAFLDQRGLTSPKKLERIRKSKGREPDKRKGRRRSRDRRRHDDGAPDPRALFDELQESQLMPALVFSFSRKDCERLARANRSRRLLDESQREAMIALQRELIDAFQLDEDEFDSELFYMARHGVAYHHAGMLPTHKEVVERMFTESLLKLLFTTETFALGINMPARTVVFQSLRKFDGITFDWLRTRDFMQMAGRAGRQGIDEHGTVVCMFGDRELREAPFGRWVSGRPGPVESRFRLSYSTLLHLVDRLGRERVHEAWDKSFHQWQTLDKNTRTRDKSRRAQRRIVEAHLAFLEELGYLDGDELTPRGRLSRQVNGYEVQLTEMMFRGVLEDIPPQALAIVFVGMVFEDRRRFDRPRIPGRLFGELRRRAGNLVAELCASEVRHGIQPEMKRPDWGLSEAVIAWCEGCTFEELADVTDATPGDVCRTFRMAIQLMRNVRRAIDPDWDLAPRLAQAVQAMNRDEVDARRQLELG